MGKYTWLVIGMLMMMAAGVGGSGCLSPDYRSEMKLAGDTVVIEAKQPVNISDENSAKVHPLPLDTWMCDVRENETTIEYAFYIDAEGLSDLDIGMTLPDGTEVHARDFKQTKSDGGWTVSADHAGIKSITLVPYGESGYYSGDWDNDTLEIPEMIGEGQRIDILMCGEKIK